MIRFFFLLALFTATTELLAKKFELVVCAIFQDEAPYLKEWIEFHKLVGVQHFFLYNNLSTDDYLTVLNPYIQNKEITLIDWPFQTVGKNWAKIQIAAYDDLLKRVINRAEWVAFLDLDEFLVPMSGNHLPTILKEYKNFGGVGVNWHFYGTSFVDKIPKDKLMIETLVHTAPETDLSQLAIKSIVNPECVLNAAQHNFTYKPGYFQVDTAKRQFEGPGSLSINYDIMKIAHYWTRDNDYFENFKIARREKVGKKIDAYARRDSSNTIQNFTMLRFVSALRKRVFG